MEAATQELRRIYRKRDSGSQCGGTPRGVLVAIKGNTVVGTADYVKSDNSMYVQGVAVSPDHRDCGVCRTLFNKAEAIAKEENLAALTLCAIKETGNVEIFKRPGFKTTNSAIAPNHLSLRDNPVTQVDMERKII